VFDPYHSSLSHQKIETIICIHDWLKDTLLLSLLNLCWCSNYEVIL